MTVVRNALDPTRFNPDLALPFELRAEDFRLAVQDVYDFTTVRLKTEQIQLVSGVSRFDLGGIGLQGA